MGILVATVCIAVIGLLVGIALVNVGKKFAVEVNPKEAAVREVLPGNNCGACGHAGCDAMAAAIARGESPVNGCPVGGEPVAKQVAKIMGVEEVSSVKKVAYVRCYGTCGNAVSSVNYVGIKDCQAAVNSGLSNKDCAYGCLGLGTCVRACPFDAIHIVDGVARVDRKACKACGKCVIACPKHIIELLPDEDQFAVRCANRDTGKNVKKVCSVGCIACHICEKQCEYDAVHVVNNISHIDYDKCQNCGKCAAKCPVKIIEQRFA